MDYFQSPYPLEGYTTYPIDQNTAYPGPLPQLAFDPSVDPYVLPYQQDGMTNYYVLPGRAEDYDEYIENLSRPRLTKEQVGTLEAQFQAQPKPNSHTKRQLALQTNLTLPRVANWFQNRRAKAKQQKRQEEFEKKQASANEEQSVSGSQKGEGHEENLAESCETSAPAQECPESRDENIASESVSGNIAGTEASEKESTPKLGHNLQCEPERLREPPSQEISPKGSGDNVSTSWNCGPVPNIEYGLEEGQQACIQPAIQFDNAGYLPQNGQPGDETLVHPFTSSSFSQAIMPMGPSPFQTQAFSGEQQESYSSVQTDVTTSSLPSGEIHSSANGASIPVPQIEKRGGLAARRKRPRPAAIGTNLSRPYMNQSNASPSRRASGWGACLSPNHSKSAHTLLPDMSPKFSGIRKTSVSPRSPLTLPPSVESTRSALSSADLTVPLSATTSMGPATPMTPEELQYLLPPTPHDTQYCLSPVDDISYTQLFRASHMVDHGENTLKPSANLSAMPNMCYPTSAPPLSASATHGTFGDCFPSGLIGPVSSSYGEDSVSPPSYQGGPNLPEVSASMPTYLSPGMYETQYSSTDDSEYWSSRSPSSSQESHKELDSSPLAYGSTSQSPYATEFLIQEFPQQREALTLAAKQLKSPTPRLYTFTNQTPHDF